jgi:hypothetical protein
VNDRDLDRLLHRLPRARAREGFTRDLLDRLDGSPEPAPRRVPWTGVAIAATAAAVVLVAVGLQTRTSTATSPERRLLDEIRAEQASIALELDALREAPSADPVLYLGGDDAVTYVVELDSLRRAVAEPAAWTATDSREPSLDR